MACPHSLVGDPNFCSQCAGVVPRRIAREGNQITIDGVPIGTVAELVKKLDEEVLERARPHSQRGGRVLRYCSRCKRRGHNARTCGVSDTDLDDDEAS